MALHGVKHVNQFSHHKRYYSDTSSEVFCGSGGIFIYLKRVLPLFVLGAILQKS